MLSDMKNLQKPQKKIKTCSKLNYWSYLFHEDVVIDHKNWFVLNYSFRNVF